MYTIYYTILNYTILYYTVFSVRLTPTLYIMLYTASEAMHHLGVPTTRALSIIETRAEVRRPWYDVTGTARQREISDSGSGNGTGEVLKSERYSPNVLLREKGAIICRVSPSFLRVAQLELFAKRGEVRELIMVADYTCLREFPDLLDLTSSSKSDPLTGSPADPSVANREISDEYKYTHYTGSPERYIAMYKRIIAANAYLVSEWLRVGYVQGMRYTLYTILYVMCTMYTYILYYIHLIYTIHIYL